MDIVEYAENATGVRLFEWQKKYLRMLDDLRSKGEIRIVMRKGYGPYIYNVKSPEYKELTQNGKTNDSK